MKTEFAQSYIVRHAAQGDRAQPARASLEAGSLPLQAEAASDFDIEEVALVDHERTSEHSRFDPPLSSTSTRTKYSPPGTERVLRMLALPSMRAALRSSSDISGSSILSLPSMNTFQLPCLTLCSRSTMSRAAGGGVGLRVGRGVAAVAVAAGRVTGWRCRGRARGRFVGSGLSARSVRVRKGSRIDVGPSVKGRCLGCDRRRRGGQRSRGRAPNIEGRADERDYRDGRKDESPGREDRRLRQARPPHAVCLGGVDGARRLDEGAETAGLTLELAGQAGAFAHRSVGEQVPRRLPSGRRRPDSVGPDPSPGSAPGTDRCRAAGPAV